MSPLVYVGLGANLGDRRATLRRAVGALGGLGRVRAASRLWESAPLHVTDQPAFLNAVVAVETGSAAPGPLVAALQRIERELGRVAGPRFGPRTIDLDLLLVAGASEVIRDGDVVVPHPRLAERRFVLAPLSELAPDAIDPRTGRTITALLEAVADQAATAEEDTLWWKTASA